MSERFTIDNTSTQNTRRLVFNVRGFSSDPIYVSQSNSIRTPGVYDAPEVYHCRGSRSLAEVPDHIDAMENFAAALTEAVRIAKSWRKYEGKPLDAHELTPTEPHQ